MPVKVRCPGCQKVLNAPDKARGKALKCPHCAERVPVPAEGAAPAPSAKHKASAPPRAKRPPRAAGSDEFLGGVNLDRMEDRSANVCPKCGATVYEEDEVCGECGVDLATGKVRAKRKGPDPSRFYGEAWSDSWKFLMANKKLAFFSGAVWTLFGLLFIGGMASTVALHSWETGRVIEADKEEQAKAKKNAPQAGQPGQAANAPTELTPRAAAIRALSKPPVVVGIFMTILMAMGAFGWYWHASAAVIEQTMRKKKQTEMRKVQFDFFNTVINGFKGFFWPLVVLSPILVSLVVVIIPLLILGSLAFGALGVVGIVLIVLGIFLLPTFALPVAQVHMTMPYTYPAFLPWDMLRIFFKNIGPALYWLLMALVVSLPILTVVFVVWLFFADDVWFGITEAVRHSANYLLALAGSTRSDTEVGFLQWMFDTFCWAVLALIVVTPFAMTLGPIAVFVMRANGLFGYYNRRNLELVTTQKPNIPCGFWVRYLAAMVDGLLILLAIIGLNIAFDIAAAGLNMVGYEFTLKARVYAMLGIFGLMPMYYYAKSEAGIFQGTLGKRSLGIKVTDMKGKPITMKQAMGRYWGKYISVLSFGVGFAMAAFTENKQTLHDLMAKALVVWEGGDDRQ